MIVQIHHVLKPATAPIFAISGHLWEFYELIALSNSWAMIPIIEITRAGLQKFCIEGCLRGLND